MALIQATRLPYQQSMCDVQYVFLSKMSKTHQQIVNHSFCKILKLKAKNTYIVYPATANLTELLILPDLFPHKNSFQNLALLQIYLANTYCNKIVYGKICVNYSLFQLSFCLKFCIANYSDAFFLYKKQFSVRNKVFATKFSNPYTFATWWCWPLILQA